MTCGKVGDIEDEDSCSDIGGMPKEAAVIRQATAEVDQDNEQKNESSEEEEETLEGDFCCASVEVTDSAFPR